MQITFPDFDHTELEALKQCLSSGWVTQGPFTQQFEALVAKRHQAHYALATTSCTAALHLATMALDLKPGDEMIVPAFTWVTSAHAAEYVGAKAVFVEVNPFSFNIDPAALEAAITPRTRAIMAVHLFGLAADMNAINAIAKKHNLAVIEDAACAIGTTYEDKPIGALGDIGCFSFHPRKIVTTGEGGMVTTNRQDLADKVQSLRNHGSTGMPENEPQGPWTMATFDRLGYNLRLSDIQAAVGVAQMAKLDKQLTERRNAAYVYSRLLAEIEEVVLPTAIEVSGHSFQSYVTRIKSGREQRNNIMIKLSEQGIQTRPGTHAVHRLGYYREKYALKAEDFPIAAMCEDTTMTLPIFPGITEVQQQQVVSIIKESLT
ncbi:DegT/DnrJ/EryC1/StrS family aminotransferase [soil metagenome]